MKRRTLFIAALLFAVAPALPAQTTNAAPATNAPPAAPPAPVSDVIAPSDILSRAQTVLDKYPAPAANPAPDPTETDIREQMAVIEPRLPVFTAETALLLSQNASVENIATLEKWGDYFATTVGTKPGATGGWLQLVSRRNNDLNTELAAIDKERKTWGDTATALRKDPAANVAYLQQVATVQARLDAVRRDTVARQKSLLQLQGQVAIDGKQVSDAMTALESARTRAISRLFESNAPPVWSSKPPPETNPAATLSWSRQLETLKTYFNAEPGRFLAHGLLLVALIGLFWWLRGYARRLTAQEPGITPAVGIFETPLAIALLLAIGASPLIYYPIAPRLLLAVLGAIALVPCVILLRRLIEPRLFPILYALVAFYFVEEFRSVAAMPFEATRAFFLAEILGAVAFLGWVLLALRRGATGERLGKAVLFAARVAFGLLSAGWLAEILGFTLLANLIFVAVQRAATLALALYAAIRIVEALLFIGMRLRPLSTLGMVRLHGPMLMRRTQRLLVRTAALVWVISVMEELPWSADVNRGLFRFLATYDDKNHLVLTLPGKLLAAIVLGWGVFQISRFVRFALETDFYPRLRLGAGVPYAISMSLHYVMLTIAFIGATAVLGIDMTKFTILVSALGVGVGFGLQNIITNFVSGLILLFERPVKIGDSVQTGDAAGVVERIGIRASVLRTAGGTEIIVPNGSLISNNVTNWTLSSEERIILIPLNVPRGPDIAHLIDLLTKAAAAHPRVLKQPPPQVQAQTLGANLGLELRAWTQAVDDWSAVRSEIVLAVNEALTKENITLA
jgi:potassium efflux system protein